MFTEAVAIPPSHNYQASSSLNSTSHFKSIWAWTFTGRRKLRFTYDVLEDEAEWQGLFRRIFQLGFFPATPTDPR